MERGARGRCERAFGNTAGDCGASCRCIARGARSRSNSSGCEALEYLDHRMQSAKCGLGPRDSAAGRKSIALVLILIVLDKHEIRNPRSQIGSQADGFRHRASGLARSLGGDHADGLHPDDAAARFFFANGDSSLHGAGAFRWPARFNSLGHLFARCRFLPATDWRFHAPAHHGLGQADQRSITARGS